MNEPGLLPDCPRTDAVLAIYLDGDVAGPDGESGYAFVCGETLRAHLLDCTSCQLQLQRARRLDAALAASAGRSTSGADFEALGERWFAAAVSACKPAAARRPLLARASTLVALAALFASGLLLLAARDGATTAAAPPAAEPVSHPAPERAAMPPKPPEPRAEAPEILIAGSALRRRAEPRRTAAAAVDVAVCVRELESGPAAAARLGAARALLAGAQPGAPTAEQAGAALTTALAGIGDRTATERVLHPYLLDLVGADAHFCGRLQSRLCRLEGRQGTPDRQDLAALTVAARLGGRALDVAIVRAVRRQPDLAEPLAAALRCGVRAHGGARLLLDVWEDLAARGAVDRAATSAACWFLGQPAHTFDEVAQELRTARSASRRIRCLLALGCGENERAREDLVAHVDRAAHEEALAAAFALSQMPHHLLAPLAAAAQRAQDAHLLRAALARAAVPAAAAWVEPLGLSAGELLLLRECGLGDFPRVAAWFRALPPPASD